MKRAILCSLVSVFALSAQESRSLLTNDLSLPNWLTVNAQARWRAEGQHSLGYVDGNDQDFLLQRYRLSVGVQPIGWMKFFGEVQDSRASSTTTDATTRNVFDLRQAYVDIGHENAWWDVKVGRQVLAFGSERMIGGSDWTNIARVFDAARLGIHHGVNRVDIFSSSVVNVNKTAWDHHQDGNNMHGIYASIGSLIPGSKMEPYLIMRTSPSFAAGPGVAGAYHSFTYGWRAAGTAKKVWFYEADILGQHGKVSSTRLSAWGAELQARRQFTSVKWQPSLMGEFNFASGDKRPGDSVVNTLDQLYPTNHSIYGIADQVGRRNNKNVRAGFWLQPRKWLTVKAEGEDFWLASRYDALYLAGGGVGVAAVPGGAASTHIGREADGVADIRLSRYYTIGAQVGHLFPGEFIQRYANNTSRTFYAVYLDLRI